MSPNPAGVPPESTVALPSTGSDNATVAMVAMFQAQKKIYARAVTGRFARWRWALVFFTQALFYGLPWLNWNGRPSVLFDLGARRFYIGPLVLYPQDFIYLTAILVISASALFLFTAVAGRLWCGYACPQTVYTEIFMWIERQIEGDRSTHMRRDAAGWSWPKLGRKTAKQSAWVALSLWTGFSFVGYFTPIRQLAGSALALGLGPWEWFWVGFYSLATYGNAGFLREQVCKYMCPYARFQSAMFDRDTLIISYDPARGEPRRSRPRKADPKVLGLGSCIDCTLCVQVCPTGIDIRDGLQYECIGCAACIDVCDKVMDKMSYPRGLIRYDTQNGLEGPLTPQQRWSRVFRPRVLIYGGVLAAVVVALGVSLVQRAPFLVDVVRDRAALARWADDGQIENVYRLQLMNATEQTQRYQLAVSGLTGLTLAALDTVELAAAQARWVTVVARLPSAQAKGLAAGAQPIQFEIRLLPAAGGAVLDGPVLREKSSFIVPR